MNKYGSDCVADAPPPPLLLLPLDPSPPLLFHLLSQPPPTFPLPTVCRGGLEKWAKALPWQEPFRRVSTTITRQQSAMRIRTTRTDSMWYIDAFSFVLRFRSDPIRPSAGIDYREAGVRLYVPQSVYGAFGWQPPCRRTPCRRDFFSMHHPHRPYTSFWTHTHTHLRDRASGRRCRLLGPRGRE